MIKCPCEECISLAICNSSIRKMTKPDVCQYSILRKCEELKMYINFYAKSESEMDISNIDNARRVFGLPIIDRDEEEETSLMIEKRMEKYRCEMSHSKS